MGFAVPYFYEDMFTAEDLQDVPIDSPIFQSYQVMHCNANRTVTSYPIPSLVEKYAVSKDFEGPIARGKNPQLIENLKKYHLEIRIGEDRFGSR